MRRSKALAFVFLGSTLIVGAAAGFTVDRVLARNVCERTDDRSSFREHLAQKLELTPSQRASVDTILDKRRRDLDAVYAPLQPQLDSARAAVLAPVRPRLGSIRVAARAEIFKVLDDKQDPLFQQLIDESQRRDSTKKEKKQQ
jgi:hypothetical protein